MLATCCVTVSVGFLQLAEFHGILFFDQDLLAASISPDRHSREGIFVCSATTLLADIELGVLRLRIVRRNCRGHRRRRLVAIATTNNATATTTIVTSSVAAVVVRRDERIVQILVLAALGRIAHAAAVTAALQALAALTAAGQTAAGAASDAPYDGQKNQTTDDDDRNDWPPVQSLYWLGSKGQKQETSGREHVLAVGSLHTIVPA
jgi:hypothetical protein